MKTNPIPNHIPAPPPARKSCRRPGLLARLAAAGLAFAVTGLVQAQSDDFNDGNDNGWFHYDPLGQFGVPTLFTVANGAYRIQTLVPTGSAQNPGRAGSVRMDVTYTDFYVAVDVVDWKDDTQQAFGVLGRVGTPGLMQTTGYAFTYERGSGVTPTSGDLDISRLDGEVPTTIEVGPSGIHLDPTKDYRFVLIGKGPNLQGQIYELPNLNNPLVVLNATDSAYPSGYCGLVVYDNSGGNGVTDATFDNYLAASEEPPRLSLTVLTDSQMLIVSWPARFTGYRLESSPVLPAAEWFEETEIATDGNFWYLSVFEYWNSENKFFRLVK